MKSRVIIATGHWSRCSIAQTLQDIAPPMLICEAALAEASYLTRSLPGARVALIEMIGEGFLSIGMAVADHHSALLAMVRRYRKVPMSLADACLVRLAELNPQIRYSPWTAIFSFIEKMVGRSLKC